MSISISGLVGAGEGEIPQKSDKVHLSSYVSTMNRCAEILNT